MFMLTKMTNRIITYAEAIREAVDISMQQDEAVFIIGEGVPDPKAIFGTTKGLKEKYGAKRVLDMPISENAVTGVCIGAAINGLKPILVYQRVDFSLLALDQLINNAAKWHYMFNGQKSVPMVIRAVIGRGWGQGAQHSQNLQALFSHIPGLMVVMPATAYDAKGLLSAAIKNNNPVVFLEHRWLHNTLGNVPEEEYSVELGKARIIETGNDISIISTSYMTIQALKVSRILKRYGISAEVVDVRTLKPLDSELIIKSVKKTKKAIVLDLDYSFCGFASEIIAMLCQNAFDDLEQSPEKITLPDLPTPTSSALEKYYYPQEEQIILKILDMLAKKDLAGKIISDLGSSTKFDTPDNGFKGPF
jgi:pyruvate/2-oxoglutarate/acetoin dehydrogenase E1 component